MTGYLKTCAVMSLFLAYFVKVNLYYLTVRVQALLFSFPRSLNSHRFHHFCLSLSLSVVCFLELKLVRPKSLHLA